MLCGWKGKYWLETVKILGVNAWVIADKNEIKEEETLKNNNICVSIDLGPLFITGFLAVSSGCL